MSSWFQTPHVFRQPKTEFPLLIITRDMHTHMTYYWDRTAGPIQMALELASTEDRNRPDAEHPSNFATGTRLGLDRFLRRSYSSS